MANGGLEAHDSRGDRERSALRAASARRAMPALAEPFAARYTLRQRTASHPRDFFIEDEQGMGVIRVSGRLPHPRESLAFEDADGRELYRVDAPADGTLASMHLLRPDGSLAATVHNALFSPARDRWRIDLPGAAKMLATGNILQREYTILRDGHTVAAVSKACLGRRDAYGIAVTEDADVPLTLAVAVVLDLMSHHHRGPLPRGLPALA